MNEIVRGCLVLAAIVGALGTIAFGALGVALQANWDGVTAAPFLLILVALFAAGLAVTATWLKMGTDILVLAALIGCAFPLWMMRENLMAAF